MKTSKILYLFILVCLLGACRDDDIINEIRQENPDVIHRVEASIQGFVHDGADGQPLEGISVTMDNNYTITDEFGFFKISGIVDQDKAVVSIVDPAYFSQYPVLSLNGIGTTHIEVNLQKKENPSSIQATAGGSILTDGGGSIDFEAASFVNENGVNYTGTVNIFSRYIDPAREDLLSIMSGNLLATNQEGERVLLQSMSMLDILLETPSGEALQITKDATVSFPVSGSLLNSAPASIPLWHFDEEEGIWVEEGVAELEGNVYRGKVSHFSLWNCDIPQNFVELCGTLILRTSSNLFGYKIRITNTENGDARCTYFNDQGSFCGLVPRGVDILFEILDECGNVIYSLDLGILEADTEISIDPTEFNLVDLETILISGSIVDCDNLPFADADVLIYSASGFSAVAVTSSDASGNFSTQVNTCILEESIKVLAFDRENDTYGISSEFSVSTEDISIGVLSACEEEFTAEAYLIDDETGARLELELQSINSGDSSIVTCRFIHYPEGESGYVIYDVLFIDWVGDLTDLAISWSIQVFEMDKAKFSFGPMEVSGNSVITSFDSGSLVFFDISCDVLGEDQEELLYDRLVISGIIE